MGTRNEAAPWWSPKAAAAWERLAAEIDTLEQAEQERDQAARRYLAALGGAATAVPTAVPPPTRGSDGDAEGEATPRGPDEERNWRQDKKVGDDVVDALKRAGYDIHEKKSSGPTGSIDIYQDVDGNLYVKPKGGQGPGTPLYVNRKDLDLR